jgi:hypothetical protein
MYRRVKARPGYSRFLMRAFFILPIDRHESGTGVEVDGGLSVLRWEMDRETLEKSLTQVEAHVAKGHERIALQHEVIAELEREGHDTVPARELLATFEKTQAMHVANRDRIASTLAALD